MNDKTKENSKKEGEGSAGKIKSHPDAVPDLSKANEKVFICGQVIEKAV